MKLEQMKGLGMRFYIVGMCLLTLSAFAANVPTSLEATTPQNIPTTAGAVSTVFISPSTVVTVTVPYFSDTYIMSGDPAWVCDKPSRCGNTFPTSTVSVTGWVYNPSGRKLISNLQVSTSLIYLYARPQDIVSGSNAVGLEWSNQAAQQ